MPIAPYSPGILSGGVAPAPLVFAPPLPPAAPAVSGPAASGLAVDTNGSLVSILPPVNDWYSPAVQTIVAPATTPSAHPCQSGGDCGCGGKCGDKNKAQVKDQETQTVAKQTSKRDLKKNPLTQQEVDEIDKLCGNTFIVGSSPSNSEIVTVDQTDQQIVIRIRRASDAVLTYERTIPKTSVGLNVEGKTINSVTPQISFGLAAYASLIGQRIVASKIGMDVVFNSSTGTMSMTPVEKPTASTSAAQPNASLSGNDQVPLGEPPPSPTPLDDSSGSNILCIPHDLVCTVPGMESDGQHMSFWIPPIGHFDADFSTCCLQHDVAWWCATNMASVIAANEIVSACCLVHLMDAAVNACSAALSCQGNSKYKIIREIEKAACDVAVAACDVVVLAVIVALELLPLLILPIGVTQLLALGLDIAAAWVAYVSNHYQYFDFDKSHTDSCLCGGTKPTIQCPGAGKYGPCDDVCKFTGLGTDAQREVCYQCGWKCNPDGIKYFDYGPNNTDGSNCCPNTSQQCTQDFTGEEIFCERSCYDCYWQCMGTATDWFWNEVSMLGELPCCEGTPPVPQNPCFGHVFSLADTCYSCTWQCMGSPSDWYWHEQSDPNGHIPCCAGTPTIPQNSCFGNVFNIADTCYDCTWQCENTPPYWYTQTDPKGQLPCCAGTPINPTINNCFGHVLRISAK